MTEDSLNFTADVSRLLDIVANALYSNKDVFLRELISNAADACDHLRYDSIKTPSLIKDDPNFRIQLYKDASARTLIIIDNGIGMNRDDLINHLGTIAKSGTRALMDQVSATKDQDEKLNLIGQFGVGFYASFMVSDIVTVISRKAGENDTWHWHSDGKTGYTVKEATEEEKDLLISARGTAIIVHLEPEYSDLLLDEKITQVIETWSDHIDLPIYLGKPAEDDEDQIQKPINAASALWTRSKSEITQDQYNEFFNHLSHGFGMDEPLLTSHWKAEGRMEYTALLYVPSMRPWNMFDPTRKSSARLYVRRVFITDDCEEILYPWLRFLRGVIDSQDLPLNISREMLQQNLMIQKIKNGVAKRILSDLDKLSRDEPEKFAAFWHQFGPVIKEGLYDAPDHRDALFKICRFFSSEQTDLATLTSLDDYVENMKEGQDQIYYLSGENIDAMRNSPQLEGFKARGLNVLFFNDTIDDFWLQMVDEYKGKKFVSITKGIIDLDQFDTQSSEQETSDTKKDKEADSKGLEKLIAMLQDTLKEDVESVRPSSRLTDSPVCLVASDSEVDLNMERVLKIHQHYESKSKRILEINKSHPLITQLASMLDSGQGSTEDIHDAAYLLLDQAKIIQGEPISDPSVFAKRMSDFLQRGLAA